jgi:hypothetical protein
MSTENTERTRGKTAELVYSSYKKNNPNYKEVWTINDSYTNYKKENLGSLELDRKTYCKVLKEVFYELSKDIIRNRLDVKLPNRLGKIRIRKRRNSRDFNKQRLDYKIYREERRTVYHVNNHTNKYYFFWDWEVNDGYGFFTNKSYYKFIPARGNDKVIGKRGLAHWVKHCSEDPTIRDYDCHIKS